MTSPLERIWNEVGPVADAAAFRRVDVTHPVDLYAGIDPLGARVLLLLTDIEPPAITVTPRGFDIEKGRRADGRWALTVSLRIADLSRLFTHLCDDLVESLRTGCRPEEAGRFVIERIARWARLLARGPKTGLDEQTYRGLLAELVVMQQRLIPAVGVGVAIPSWFGPLDADQDFRLPGRLVEVKSTVIGSLMVTVSSAEQLDVHNFPLFLATVPIGNGVQGNDMTLQELVDTIRDLARDDPASLNLFDERLGMTGYIPNDLYATRPFITGQLRCFHVTQGFPRLVRSLLPSPVFSVKYQLDLALCSEFEVHDLFG
jgi:hypothetical protein